MEIGQLEQLLRARFAGFFPEHTPPLEDHPAALAEVPTAAPPAATWSALAERGALVLPTPRAAGGLGLGQPAAVLIAELMGAAAFPAGAYLDTLLGLDLLDRCRPSAGRSRLQREVVEGRRRIAVAFRDGSADRTPDTLPRWAELAQEADLIRFDARFPTVESADQADTLLLVGAGVDGVLPLAADDPAVLLEPRSVLGGRRLFDVDACGASVPRSDLLEFAGDPDGVWSEVLGRARLRQAAHLVGLAAGALDAAVGYARNRRQFGKPLGRFQSISFRLAAATARIEAARLLVRDTAVRAEGGEPVAAPAARALAFAAELGRTVTAEALHVHGAFGMTLQSSAQRYFRAAGTESVWLGVVPELRKLVPA
ncbi:acyl-CoA dehydrogenase family protein [Kitasatospora sp. NPDC093550]|uniref:acyl-CoA dehydrogenase family protein n=1 Tax=Kitasatospora sp. NPDC093550 TaxID=3364089 RepID=UPI0037F6DA69